MFTQFIKGITVENLYTPFVGLIIELQYIYRMKSFSFFFILYTLECFVYSYGQKIFLITFTVSLTISACKSKVIRNIEDNSAKTSERGSMCVYPTCI